MARNRFAGWPILLVMVGGCSLLDSVSTSQTTVASNKIRLEVGDAIYVNRMQLNAYTCGPELEMSCTNRAHEYECRCVELRFDR
jgi:hypothetical protein